jgi:hypothetical protein
MSAELIWGWATVGFALMVPATLWAGHHDRRLLAGVNVWAKPFKFALSLAIHYATFAVIARCLPEDERQRTWLIVTAAVSTAAGVAELGYIALQAARGRHSHFNTSTPVEAVAAALMGVGSLIVVSPAVVIGVALTVTPPNAWSAAVTVGTIAGLIGGAVLTVMTASQMGAARSHFVNGKKPGSGMKMPITGWSLDGADLRPSHFLATHMMQAVPIISVITAEALPPTAALMVSALAALGWTAMTLALFRWTMKGRPLAAILGKPRRLTRFDEVHRVVTVEFCELREMRAWRQSGGQGWKEDWQVSNRKVRKADICRGHDLAAVQALFIID